MIKKIREYVNYQLRFDHSEDVEEKKEEIIANITDRYEEILKDTHDRQYAYIEAIKSMGDFTSNSTEIQDSYKPKAAEMFLLSGLILAVFSLLLMMFNPVIGGIVVMLSIVFFSTGAMYLYQESQYVKDKEFDIDKHHAYLKKVFAYMKTCFTFWSISISLLITLLLYGLITSLIVLNASNNFIGYEEFKIIIFISAIIFIFIFIILMLVFRSIYNRLSNKYFKLTGEETIVSIGKKAKAFLDTDNINNTKSPLAKVYPIYVLIFSGLIFVVLIVLLFILDEVRGVYPFIIALSFMIVITNIILALAGLLGKVNIKFLVPIVYIMSSVFFGYIFLLGIIGLLSLLSGIVLTILLVIDFVGNLSRLKK
jgi:hypothetical protein